VWINNCFRLLNHNCWDVSNIYSYSGESFNLKKILLNHEYFGGNGVSLYGAPIDQLRVLTNNFLSRFFMFGGGGYLGILLPIIISTLFLFLLP